MTKLAGSGSISQRHESAVPDPDPHQNVIDPQHCKKHSCLFVLRYFAKNHSCLFVCCILLPKNTAVSLFCGILPKKHSCLFVCVQVKTKLTFVLLVRPKGWVMSEKRKRELEEARSLAKKAKPDLEPDFQQVQPHFFLLSSWFSHHVYNLHGITPSVRTVRYLLLVTYFICKL
jgi:hypothetical protein